MLSPVPKFSPRALRTDKIHTKLVRWSYDCDTDRAATTSLLCDARSQPTGKAAANGCLVN